MEYSKDYEIAGFYGADENLIGLDLFANPGTPNHELRHYRQHLLDQLLVKTNLSYKCLQTTLQFLGELDATTEQISSWETVFDNIEIEALLDGGEHPTRLYPQTKFLSANLNYPMLASGWIDA